MIKIPTLEYNLFVYRFSVFCMNRAAFASLLRSRRSDLQSQGVKSLLLIGPAAHNDHNPGDTVDFLLELNPPLTYWHFREVRDWLAALLNEPVDVTLANPADPAIAPYLDRGAVKIL